MNNFEKLMQDEYTPKTFKSWRGFKPGDKVKRTLKSFDETGLKNLPKKYKTRVYIVGKITENPNYQTMRMSRCFALHTIQRGKVQTSGTHFVYKPEHLEKV